MQKTEQGGNKNKEHKVKPIIKLKNIDVKYNLGKASEFHALKNISIEIYPGEFVVFFGPSGCGKSTLLNVIAGLETPCHGGAEVGGENILKYNYDQLSDYHVEKIGMIFQAYNLIESLSIEDNIALPQMFKDEPILNRKKNVKNLLDRFQISEHAKKRPTTLSGGQQQRVGIARSLINNPLLLLADEPIGNLDSANADIVLKIFKSLNEKDKKTIILVTHNPDLLRIAHRVLYMKDGLIVKEEINNDIRPSSVRGALKEREGSDKIPKELELLLKSYSGLTADQITTLWIPMKAKIITEHILNKYSRTQRDIIESTIRQRIMGLIKKEHFIRTLDVPLAVGGAGLDKRAAESLSERVEEVLTEVEKIKKYSKADKTDEGVNKTKELITGIRHHLMEFSHRRLEQKNIDRLNKFIEQRLNNKIDKKKFINFISYSLKKGGAGFSRATARKFGRELEMLMLMKFGDSKNKNENNRHI